MREDDLKEKLKAELFVSAIAKVIAEPVVIAIVSAAASIAGAELLGNTITFLEEYKWPIGLSLFVAITVAAYQINVRWTGTRPIFPRLEFEFRVLERTISYEYFSATKMVYKRRYVLRALRNGLGTYHDQFRWTGDGPIQIKSAIPEHEVHLTGRKNVWQLFEIRFHKTLRKREVIEAEVVWDLEDPRRKAVPFFSVTIQEPTDKLRLELKLPIAFDVKEVVCEHSPDIGAKLPFESETKRLDRNGVVAWEIMKPGLLHYYEMKWVNNFRDEP